MGDAEPLLKTEEYVCHMNDEITKMLKHYRNTASRVYIPKQATVNVLAQVLLHAVSESGFLGHLQVKPCSVRPSSLLVRSLTPVQATSTTEKRTGNKLDGLN